VSFANTHKPFAGGERIQEFILPIPFDPPPGLDTTASIENDKHLTPRNGFLVVFMAGTVPVYMMFMISSMVIYLPGHVLVKHDQRQ
jgi:hypothetical protein